MKSITEELNEVAQKMFLEIEEQKKYYIGEPNCVVISRYYYNILNEYVFETLSFDFGNSKPTKLYGLVIIIVENPHEYIQIGEMKI